MTSQSSIRDARGIGLSRGDRIVNSRFGCEKVLLGTGAGSGGIFAWQNPHPENIIVLRVVLNITAASLGACTVDVGTAADGSTSSGDLLDGTNVNQVATLDNHDHTGTNGRATRLVNAKNSTTDYITGSVASGSASGMAGHAYIFYLMV